MPLSLPVIRRSRLNQLDGEESLDLDPLLIFYLLLIYPWADVTPLPPLYSSDDL